MQKLFFVSLCLFAAVSAQAQSVQAERSASFRSPRFNVRYLPLIEPDGGWFAGIDDAYMDARSAHPTGPFWVSVVTTVIVLPVPHGCEWARPYSVASSLDENAYWVYVNPGTPSADQARVLRAAFAEVMEISVKERKAVWEMPACSSGSTAGGVQFQDSRENNAVN
jgi:hypothetical protein